MKARDFINQSIPKYLELIYPTQKRGNSFRIGFICHRCIFLGGLMAYESKDLLHPRLSRGSGWSSASTVGDSDHANVLGLTATIQKRRYGV